MRSTAKKSLNTRVTLVRATMLFAQVVVNGTVKDHKGSPLPGVSISIKDSYDGAVSDSMGRYSFKTF
jgi:hypothetical protein